MQKKWELTKEYSDIEVTFDAGEVDEEVRLAIGNDGWPQGEICSITLPITKARELAKWLLEQ